MSRIPQEKIDEIRSAANIYAYVSRYVALKKSGRNYFGLCPFHQEKTGSFSVSAEKQIFHCFGCGKGGDVFTFLTEIEKISYIEAIRKVAGDLGISLPVQRTESTPEQESEYNTFYHTNETVMKLFQNAMHETNSPATKYIKKRNLKPNTVQKFQIGFAPDKWDFISSNKKLSIPALEELGLIHKKEKEPGHYDKFRNRLIFPFHNLSGSIVGFGGRRLNDKDNPKYLNSPESKIYKKGDILYGLHQAITAIRERNMAILVEGYFDLLRLVDSGIENVVASSGTALTEQQGRLIKRYTQNVVISYDSDEAGIKAAIRNSQILQSIDINVYVLILPTPHDPDSFVLEHGQSAFLKLLEEKITPLEFQIMQFKREHPNATIEQKNELIDSIMEDLIRIPNHVRIGLLIRQLSEKMEIGESLLINQFTRLKKLRRFQKPAKNPLETENEVLPKTRFRRGNWQAEEGILALLLKSRPEITKMILHQLSFSDFENEDLRDIYAHISAKWEELEVVDFNELQNSLDDTDEKSILARLSLIEIENDEKYASDCIYQIRKWHLNTRFNQLKHLLQEELLSPQSVAHYSKELMEIRMRISEIENEHQKMIKNNL